MTAVFGRPAGTYGGVALALRHAATQGPGTVRALAQRAQVGYATARYTASRLCERGELVVLDGQARPAVLAAPEALPVQPGGDTLGDALAALHASFWGSGPSGPSAPAVPAQPAALEDDDPGGI